MRQYGHGRRRPRDGRAAERYLRHSRDHERGAFAAPSAAGATTHALVTGSQTPIWQGVPGCAHSESSVQPAVHGEATQAPPSQWSSVNFDTSSTVQTETLRVSIGRIELMT